MKFVKKPVVIEAIEWTGDNLLEIVRFMGQRTPNFENALESDKWDEYKEIVDRDGLIIKTLEGQHIASIGDWIIKGIKGEFYPCKPDIFAMTYDRLLEHKLESFREENERLRKDAEVGASIQRAAAELPVGYIVGISVEADAATVELCLPTGHIKSMDVDDDNRLAAEINAAIDAARGAK